MISGKLRENFFKFFRERGFKSHRFLMSGEQDRQTVCMEKMTRQLDALFPPPVQNIPYDRAFQKSHMNTDLMRPAGQRMSLDERMLCIAFQRPVFCNRFSSFIRRQDRHLLSADRIPADRSFAPSGGGRRSTVNQRKITFVDRTFLKLLLQKDMRLFILSHNDNA